MKRALLGAAASLAIALVAPALVQANPSEPEVARLVAGPTASGARLLAYDEERHFCLDVRHPRSGSSVSCGRPLRSLRQPLIDEGSTINGGRRRTVLAGAVAPEVASVEVVYRRGARIRAPTEGGERYKGRFAGKLRFFIAERSGRGDQSALYFRLLDTDGDLLAAVPGPGTFRPGAGPATLLRSGRVAGKQWSLSAFSRRQFTPLPGEEERFETLTCVKLTARGSRTRGEACAGEDERLTPVVFGRDQGCSPLGAAVTGLVSKEVVRLQAVLGDGAERRLVLRKLPARFGSDRRAFALALPRDVAVRRLEAFGPEGPIRRLPLGLAPGSIRCGFDGAFLSLFGGEDLPPSRPDGDGPDLLIRDEGTLLCLAIDAFDRKGRDCARPPLETFASRFAVQAGPRGTLAAGVVPLEVATVRLEFDGGQRRTFEATSNVPYAGRYQGEVRFVDVLLPGRRKVFTVRLFDDEGRSLGTVPGPDSRPLQVPFRTLARIGPFRLGAAVGAFEPTSRSACLTLTRSAYPRDSGECGASADLLEIRALCAPHRIAVLGLVRPRVRSVFVRTHRGVVRGRVIAFPKVFKLRHSVLLVTVPAKHAPRELILTGRRGSRQKLELPPATRQCGYEDLTFLNTPRS